MCVRLLVTQLDKKMVLIVNEIRCTGGCVSGFCFNRDVILSDFL